jgi:hypothetical protein
MCAQEEQRSTASGSIAILRFDQQSARLSGCAFCRLMMSHSHAHRIRLVRSDKRPIAQRPRPDVADHSRCSTRTRKLLGRPVSVKAGCMVMVTGNGCVDRLPIVPVWGALRNRELSVSKQGIAAPCIKRKDGQVAKRLAIPCEAIHARKSTFGNHPSAVGVAADPERFRAPPQ